MFWEGRLPANYVHKKDLEHCAYASDDTGVMVRFKNETNGHVWQILLVG